MNFSIAYASAFASKADKTASSAAASALFTVPMYLGTATAAKIPNMIVTMINSINVKPLLLFLIFILLVVYGCSFLLKFFGLSKSATNKTGEYDD